MAESLGTGSHLGARNARFALIQGARRNLQTEFQVAWTCVVYGCPKVPATRFVSDVSLSCRNHARSAQRAPLSSQTTGPGLPHSPLNGSLATRGYQEPQCGLEFLG